MSAVELQKTIESLVEVVSEKNRELEKIKSEYDAKLREISQYLDTIQDSVNANDPASLSDRSPNPKISDEKLIETVKQHIKCPKCDAEVWNIEQNTNYILIPRLKLQIVQQKHVSAEPVQPKPFTFTKKSAKKTCSYCHQTGHSRARCLQRLNNDSNSLQK